MMKEKTQGQTGKDSRFLWAADILNIRSSSKILEIGFGPGVAATYIASRLTSGHIFAIDRSKTMLTRATARNQEYIRQKKAFFECMELNDLPPGKHAYNRIFAFNVNLFWTQKSIAKEAAILRSHLAPNGLLYLFYQTSAPAGIKKIRDLVSKNLGAENFDLREIITEPRVDSCCLICNMKKNTG